MLLCGTKRELTSAMNDKIKILIDIIQKTESLKDAERNTLLEELKAAEKEFEITAFKLERTEKAKKTTATLLEETIEELEQKRRAVEAQNRELEIEAALERIRTHNMAMQDSGELAETASVFFNEFKELNLLPAEARTYFSFIDSRTDTASVWLTQADGTVRPGTHNVPLNGTPQLKKVYNAWKQKKPLIIRNMSGKELDEYISFVSTLPHVQKDSALKKLLSLTPKRIVMTEATFRYGTIGIMTNELLSEEAENTLVKFARVFEQTYTRFLDLKKAEGQAKEAEIQLALERVRSRTMAMLQSNELAETAADFYIQLNNLGIKPYRFNIAIVDEQIEKCQLWSTTNEGKIIPSGTFIPLTENNVINQMYEGWKNKQDSIIKLVGEERVKWTQYIAKYVFFSEYQPENIDLEKIKSEAAVFSNFCFKQGFFVIHTIEEIDSTDLDTIQRFANLFEQTYTRFLDLKKAEAQAREAQIETALERVRSRSMAMHSTSELQDVVNTLARQFHSMEMEITGGVFITINKEVDKELTFWGSSGVAETYVQKATVPFLDRPIYTVLMNAIRNREGFIVEEYTREEKMEFFKHMFKYPPYNSSTPEWKKQVLSREGGYARSVAVSHHTTIFMINHQGKKFSDSDNNILKRFGKVFEQSYIRFLDLQKAEVQAREAKIEAALERIRARALGMHHSSEVGEVSNLLFTELENMNIKLIGFNIIVLDKNQNRFEMWRAKQVAVPNDFESFSYEAMYDKLNHYLPGFVSLFEAEWNAGKPYYVSKFSGKERISFLTANREIYNYTSGQFEKMKNLYTDPIFWNMVFFKQGWLGLISNKALSGSDLLVSHRFAEVFDFAYTRFLDLKKAEAQAKEAIKQSSLDRVRAEIASMRTADDLNRITPIIWHELKALEVPFIRCGLYIIDEEQEKVRVYLTTPDGKALGVLNLSFDVNEITRNTVDHWRKEQVFKEFWDKQGFINWTKSMIKLGQVKDAVTYQGSAEPPESLHLHFIPFNQGMLYVGDTSPLPEDKLQLVKSLAEAFSIAYARYEDFKNLEAAKNRIEITLSDLKSTQAQLLHAEKMASLGELTTGIAHEIKNPLNFVNNFSEVSRELLDEMNIELRNNNVEEAIEMVENLKQNLEKINHHGKRADFIIKSMLLHSRGSSGEKIMTNINELLDQYVVLAYHGMRAQNKEFNISIEKVYDESVPKINVVPQDISRVFLNIVNNACYAAHEKKKNHADGYSPLLMVSTKNLKDTIEIRIKDNGNGIPASVKENIFNPFFTTKPTGEGTGLGLSLSFDIITKVHGGNIKVESEEGKYTEFTIILPKQ
jgi:signal transduction histidine kinase